MSRHALECIQEPGDILFVPSGWAHGVYNLAETVGYVIVVHCMGVTLLYAGFETCFGWDPQHQHPRFWEQNASQIQILPFFEKGGCNIFNVLNSTGSGIYCNPLFQNIVIDWLRYALEFDWGVKTVKKRAGKTNSPREKGAAAGKAGTAVDFSDSAALGKMRIKALRNILKAQFGDRCKVSARSCTCMRRAVCTGHLVKQ